MLLNSPSQSAERRNTDFQLHRRRQVDLLERLERGLAISRQVSTARCAAKRLCGQSERRAPQLDDDSFDSVSARILRARGQKDRRGDPRLRPCCRKDHKISPCSGVTGAAILVPPAKMRHKLTIEDRSRGRGKAWPIPERRNSFFRRCARPQATESQHRKDGR